MKSRIIVFGLLVICLSACRQKEDIRRFQVLQQELEETAKTIEKNNESIYEDLRQRIKEPYFYPYANVWQLKSVIVKQQADSLLDYIGVLQGELQKKTGYPGNDSTGRMEDEKQAAVERLFTGQGVAAALSLRMTSYTEKVSSIFDTTEFRDNPLLQQDLRRQKEKFLTLPLVWSKQHKSDFIVTGYFKNNCAAGAMAMLSKMKNDVLLSEEHLFKYCRSNCSMRHWYTSEMPLAHQNTNCLRAGEKLEITAGIGEFSYAPKPKIYFNGNLAPLNEDVVAIYTMTVSGKPGKYSVPLRIEYYHADGQLWTVRKRIEYTIVK